MSAVQQSPSLTAKLKTKDAVNKMKNGSPKFQEVLRQRCRQRMKEKRGQLFDKRRHGLMEIDAEVRDVLTDIVQHEFQELMTLERTIAQHDHFQPEVRTGSQAINDLFVFDDSEERPLSLDEFLVAEEEEQWILMEFERLQNDEAEMLALLEEDFKDNVICPLCEKDVIAESSDALSCLTCDFRMPRKASVRDFGQVLQDKLSLHSSTCGVTPSFMSLPENGTVNLYLTCESCSSIAHII